MPVYGLNCGGGALREVVTHDEDTRRINEMKHGAREGVLPEIADEDLVRAFLVIRANSVPYEAATPEFMQMIVDLLNKRVTPVMHSRGTLGEGDLFLTSNFLATMAGGGDAYFQGVRMDAGDALTKAGLKPLSTEPGGGTSNAYADAQAALLVADAQTALEWTDLIHALDKLGMNSSLALQLQFFVISESMGNHDSGGHGCREPRLRRRLSFGLRLCVTSKRGFDPYSRKGV
jgi:histidine ammonia-lyase